MGKGRGKEAERGCPRCRLGQVKIDALRDLSGLLARDFTGGVDLIETGSDPREQRYWRRVRCRQCRACWRLEEQTNVGIGPPSRVTGAVTG